MRQFIYYQKQAWANLQKKVAFVATVIITMGTTLGVLLCVLTLGHLLLVKPLPYPEQDRLYKVNHIMDDNKGEITANAFTYPGLIHLYKNQDIFEETALFYYSEDVLTSLSHQPRLAVGYITPEWFNLLGSKVALGRLFEATEGLDKNNPVAILTYKTWQEEFAGRADILGQKVSFSGITYRIVGVLDKHFIEPQINNSGLDTTLWLPWDFNPQTRFKERWGNIDNNYTFVGRIKPDISKEQADQTLTPLINNTWQEQVVDVPFFNGWTIAADVVSFKNTIVGDSKRMIIILSAGVLGLVIIAFTNVANLFMSRTAEQQRQLALYAALGAKKSHLLRTLFAESSNLMAVAILLALVIASIGFNLMQTQFATILPRLSELKLNIFTLGAGVAFAFLFALLFALISAKMINYRKLNAQLQSSGKGTGVQVSKKFRQILIVSQIAVATVLVFANINLFNGVVKIIQQPLGFQIDNMVTVALSISTTEEISEEEGSALMTSVRQKISALPEVKSVSQSNSPLRYFSLIAITEKRTNTSYTPDYKQVDANYFEQIQQPLLSGRVFTSAEIRDGAYSVIVNDVFAKTLSESGDALGIQLEIGDNPHTIIGVVKNVTLPGPSTRIANRLYLPASPASTQMNLTLEPYQSISREQVVAAIEEVSSRYALFNLQVLPQQKDEQLFIQYATAVTTAILAIVTLFLASVGLYGIISYGTQMRRFEIGTRMAIGAKRGNLISLIVHDNARVIIIGFVLSIVLLGAGYFAYGDNLAEYVNLSLITVFAATLISISLLALFACYWPLRQYINNPAIHLLRGSE